MKTKFYLSILLLSLNIQSIAQMVTLRGRVTDARTGAGISGVSILSGSLGTSADAKGNFVFYVQLSVVESNGLTASCVGYETTHLSDFTDDIDLNLKPRITELKTVEVTSGAEYMIQKAYRQIALNYLDRDFNILGMERMVHTIRDTTGYQYYYTNDSSVKLYLSAYKDTPKVAQIALMDKAELKKSNPKADRLHFIDGYLITIDHDYVHNGAGVLRGDTAKFKYKLNRKEWIEGRRTYAVNFYAKSGSYYAGIIYLDTASYAYVKILYTKYNVTGPRSIALDKVTSSVSYRKFNDKWVLENVKFNSITGKNGFTLERTDEFQASTIITEEAEQLPESARVRQRMIDDHATLYSGFSQKNKELAENARVLLNAHFPKIKVPEFAGTFVVR